MDEKNHTKCGARGAYGRKKQKIEIENLQSKMDSVEKFPSLEVEHGKEELDTSQIDTNMDSVIIDPISEYQDTDICSVQSCSALDERHELEQNDVVNNDSDESDSYCLVEHEEIKTDELNTELDFLTDFLRRSDVVTDVDDILPESGDLSDDDLYVSDDSSEYSDLDLNDFVEEIASKEDIVDDQDNKPLYPGCSVTLGAFMLLLAIFCTKHNIIGDGVHQLLNIIALVLPKEHILCKSLHSYKMFFKNLRNPLKYHYYCEHCFGTINDTSTTICPNNFCNKPFNKKDKNYFLEIPIVNQLKNLFLQDGFYNSVQSRFHRNISDGVYEDIYDGQLYKSYCFNDGPLSKPENISFTCNTDGAPVFKSSNVSIWPIFLCINELPYKLRMKKENMILASLWFGSNKPSMSTFLNPFLNTMKEHYEGVELFAPNIGSFISKGFLLSVTSDLPARSLLCNSNQYNGAFSCWKCKQKGITAKVGKGHTHVFPYDPVSPKGPERTPACLLQDARAAVDQKIAGNTKSVVNGIKGPSWLLLMPKFNIISGIAIDYMHGVLLGVQKLLLRLWFSPTFSKESFNFKDLVSSVDEKLKKIRPTLDITRLPRSIEKDLKYWKASEFRSFLLFHGPVVLLEIIDLNRYCHYLLLVNAIHILLKAGSTEEDLNIAENMLLSFCGNFSNLYNKRFMTLNMHQLVHLADSVRYLGPLYTHSCFSFEDKNGVLLKMIKGTQCIDNQIITGVSFVQKLPELKQKCIVRGSEEEKLYNSIDSPYLLKRNKQIGEGIFILGSVKKKPLELQELRALCTHLGEMPTCCEFPCFSRIEIREMIIYGQSYKRMQKRDNSTVCFNEQNTVGFARVRFFMQLMQKDGIDNVAVVEILKCDNYKKNSGILSVKVTDDICVLPIGKIQSSCMFSCLDIASKKGYVCIFPNRQESD